MGEPRITNGHLSEEAHKRIIIRHRSSRLVLEVGGLAQRTFVVAAFAAVLLLSAALTALPFDATATHDPGWCGRDAVTIPVGAGSAGNGVAPLEGITYVDLEHKECSGGSFWIDHSSTGGQVEQHCAEGFLRVFAAPNTFGTQVIINWVPASSGSC